ncbi:MAG TPA: NYN domain-containing protein [Thermoanaerobaculia bacterium]|nr:NYN domain-containing protein [Thermoanaerobaculia bacterium]
MSDRPFRQDHLRTALFVDFDNIYLRLQHEDPRAAEQFATNPSRWLDWLRLKLPREDAAPGADAVEGGEEGAGGAGGERGLSGRKILFRRCYLNPSQFGRFRPDFSRAAFEVVDCPPLTSGGKTSADIHMVMDILDTLNHPTHFDEFIILSGDADFTPVLLRLSKHDRRSAVLAIGPASAAYKAACDLLIDEDTFLEEAIGAMAGPARAAGGGGSPAPSAMTELLGRIADKVYERADASGELVATDLPAIYREFPEFTASTNWLGWNGLRAMTWAVIHARPDLTMIEGDPWKVRLRAGAAAPAAETEEGEPAESGEAAAGGEDGSGEAVADRAELIRQIVEHVRGIVASSDAAVPMARAAQMVIGRFGDVVLSSHWAGAGTFRDLLGRHAEPGFAISSLKPGYLYDPEQHQVPAAGHEDMETDDPELAALAYRVHQLTDTPYLTPAEYALAFRLIAEEVRDHGYFLHRTSKAVRDRSIEEGSPVARASINFILRGIAFAGHRLGQAVAEDPLSLAGRFAKNVLVLCDSAGLQLSPEERERLSDWLLGDLRPAAAEVAG